jgi:GTP-binding protein
MLSDDFRVLIVGRTNVGKSTLFNRLTHARDAIVFDRHGVTRDAKEKLIDICGRQAVLIDSPGMFDYAEYNSDKALLNAISKKLDELVRKADLVVFVLDGVSGVTLYDQNIANFVRKGGKRVVVAINKSEKKIAEYSYVSATELGFPEIYKISAEHGNGVGDLMEAIARNINTQVCDVDSGSTMIKLAIVGAPNVGKSTMVNTILGQNKQLVADYSGLTRESAEFTFNHNDVPMTLVDTAGIRRRSRVCDMLEKISVSNTRKCYRNADAVILMIDATTLESGHIEKQNLTLAADILKHGKALVIAFNKVDKTPYGENDVTSFITRSFNNGLSQLKDVPFVFVSALQNGVGIKKMLDMVIAVHEKQKIKIRTTELNEWLRKIGKSGLMQSSSAKFKLKYITQISVLPPTFLIFVTNADNIRLNHKRFIMNSFKKDFGIFETVVRILFRSAAASKA